MRYLYPSGGAIPEYFAGYLLSPAMRGIPSGIKNGAPWACDNGAFTGCAPVGFINYLDKLTPYSAGCVFVVVPDVVGNATETLRMFTEFAPLLAGWPLSFVAQDGQELLDFPDDFDVLFIGGSTEWKMSPAAVECIQRAQVIGKHVHIGRVNWRRRYQYFRGLPGSDKFTCDGTRIKFGRKKTIDDWKDYQDEKNIQLNLFIPFGDCGG